MRIYSQNNIFIERLVLGELATNCYLLGDNKTQQAIIIDPADEANFISERILELNLTPQAILLTHGHFDHILGLLELKLNFDVPIYLHEADLFLLESLPQRAKYWLKRDDIFPAPKPEKLFNKNINLNFKFIDLKILHTPGHTPGSVCYYNDEFIFTGDTIFKDAVGRTDFKYSNSKKLFESIKKIKELTGRLALPGHGEEFWI